MVEDARQTRKREREWEREDAGRQNYKDPAPGSPGNLSMKSSLRGNMQPVPRRV